MIKLKMKMNCKRQKSLKKLKKVKEKDFFN